MQVTAPWGPGEYRGQRHLFHFLFFSGDIVAGPWGVQITASSRNIWHVKRLKNSEALLAGFSVTLDDFATLDETVRTDQKRKYLKKQDDI